MTPEIELKLEHAQDRYEEIALLLADPDVMADQNKFRDLSKEYAQIEPLVLNYRDYKQAQDDIVDAQDMLADEEMADLAKVSVTAP